MKALVTTLVALALLMPTTGFADPGPEEILRQTAGALLQKLEENEAVYREDPALLEALVREDLMPAMDINYSARLILGRAGRGASPEQIDAFAVSMSEALVTRYAKGMLEYRNREQLEIMPVRGELKERATRVRTRVQTHNGAYIPVDYVFRKTDQGWKAFDVIVEGISYVTTYRNQIMPQVQESGIDAVTQRLGSGELTLKD